MTGQDPGVRDLLVAIHTTLNGATAGYPAAAVRVAVENTLCYGVPASDSAAWLASDPVAGGAADAWRVQVADRSALARERRRP